MEPDLEHRTTEPAPPHSPLASPSENPPETRSEQSALHFTTHDFTHFDRVFVGPHGLRAGWSILLFYLIYYILRIVIGTVFFTAGLIGDSIDGSASSVLIAELIPLLSLLAAAAIMALIESRRLLSYNLSGPHRLRHFLVGAALGFASLSLLVAELAFGGWLRFGAASTSVAQSLRLAILWGCAFLVVAVVEECLFRCYALSTVARGINFWWALAAQAVICAYAFLHPGDLGAPGVYLAALLGALPCYVLHQRSAARSAFWQAAWVTSTVFGLYHTFNGGENWIGIFAAAAIGFVFCISVRFTGSAFWALGFHAAWDWAETFFYGTADSGLEGQGHLFSATPQGNALWSGGTDGPEGSLLVFGVILLLFLFVIVVYGRARRAAPAEL
jgi:membrane protease YdiL (CAAX protease family)